ncbi:MAG: hypothetical protein QG656_2704, partial [Candidatus Hydrogenedentes bacterium]|nr:hypothetical protein [Candidatus Hydrogenedentota bacterium]
MTEKAIFGDIVMYLQYVKIYCSYNYLCYLQLRTI